LARFYQRIAAFAEKSGASEHCDRLVAGLSGRGLSKEAPDLAISMRSRCASGLGQPWVVPSLHPSIAAPLQDAVTQRLTLRRLTGDDLDNLVVLFADPGVWWFEYERGLTAAETEAFVHRQVHMRSEFGFGACAVRNPTDSGLLGVVGLGVPTVAHPALPSVTVGWRFASVAWGRGYATEAATALLDQAFVPMRVEAVGCVTNANNERSIAVARRLGMKPVGEVTGLRDDGLKTVTAAILRVEGDHWSGSNR
jgi:RimJ/RimL family protein N-acetyltransferase